MIELLVFTVFLLLAILVTFFAMYQLALACSYFIVREQPSPPMAPQKRFAVIIPAHNEESMIGAALESWARVDYPPDLFSVHVIADNCTDRTAEVVLARGGSCLERQDPDRQGKGYALAWALETITLDPYDAIVIVDADTAVCPDFLLAMNTRLVGGAKVIQGFDGILNPDESLLTRLMHITNIMKNLLFNHAKSKVGLSVQLMGTGMCFDRAVLQKLGWNAFSIGEDGEQFSYLAEAGVRVEFEPRAIVYAHEASSFDQAYTQRIRWSSGRMQLVGLGLRLLGRGIRRRDLHLIDAALTFLIPSYVQLGNVTILACCLTLFVTVPGRDVLLPWFSALLAAQALYFFMGLGMSGLSTKSLSSLSLVPVFLVWKMGVDLIAILHLNRSVWVRTARLSSREKRSGLSTIPR